MAQIAFNSKFETGNAKVDAQHKKLFDLVGVFFTQVGTGNSKNRAIETLKEICEYAKSHFRDEEALMREANYPQIAQHIALHNELNAQAANLLQQYNAGTLVLSADLARFLNDWLINHILQHDLAMIRWVRENAQPRS